MYLFCQGETLQPDKKKKKKPDTMLLRKKREVISKTVHKPDCVYKTNKFKSKTRKTLFFPSEEWVYMTQL